MKSLFRPLRRSLFLKVFTFSSITAIALIFSIGSNLFTRISNGIIEEKINSSIAEGSAAIQYANYRFIIGSVTNSATPQQLAEEVIKSTNVSAQESGRETILFSVSGNSEQGIPAALSSNYLEPLSVPNSLRNEVRIHEDVKWEQGTLKYSNGEQIEGIFIGQKIDVPRVGEYEIYVAFGFQAQRKSIDLIRNAMWGTGLLLITLLMMMATFVLRSIIRRVRAAAEIAEKLTSGELQQKMEEKGEDELARLGTAFNEMASTLASQITRLENLSKIQQRFVSDVSHELRTPLTTIRMAADVIHNARGEFDPNVSRSAELLLSQINRFEALLADLLEVSRFDANVSSVAMAKVDICEVVRKVGDELSHLAIEKGCPLQLHIPTDPVVIDGDQLRLERILRNLITNAIDHAEQMPIDISVVGNESDVSIGVRDYGVGLTAAQLSRVFDRFWRADPSRSRIRGGTGLGLAIAKDDAALHGGVIKVWGEMGKGSNFVLSIPRAYGAQLTSTPLSEIPS